MARRASAAAALVAALAAVASACAPRSQPYRFAMPMLGQADVPPPVLPGADDTTPAGRRAPARTRGDAIANHEAHARSRERAPLATGWQADAQSGIRTVSARGIEIRQGSASAAAADAIAAERGAQPAAWSRLPAPHRTQARGVTSAIELPRMAAIREPAGLRALVGTRDRRYSFAIVMGWLDELGISLVARGPVIDMANETARLPTDGPALVAWAETRGKRFAPGEPARPGDLLVFDRALSDSPADLVALVIARDERGVLEFMYAGGGVIRRGFVDPARPSLRRDLVGAVVNTFLRHGKHWPPKGTRYLAGELLAHVIRVR